MKLVICGSSGYLGTELVRQALSNPSFTSVIGFSRRETPLPPDTSRRCSKFKSVVCDNFENYPESVRKELADADACIWTIAVTPSKSKGVPWTEICKVSRDYALTAIKTISTVPRKEAGPFRFIYLSGHFTQRNKGDVPEVVRANGMEELVLMRGEAETLIIEYGEKSNGAVESAVAKPGYILSPDFNRPPVPGVPTIQLREIGAALLDQVSNGFESDTLSNDDMIRIGQKILG